MFAQTQPTIEDIEIATKQANLYRTKWLITYNALHALVHRTVKGVQSADEYNAEKDFQAYLLEMERAPEIALQIA
jgi:hypothetical protein